VLCADFPRSIACRSLLLSTLLVFGLSARSQAAPLCTDGSLSDYLALGSCSIGSTTFSNFALVTPLPFGATPIPTNQVTVTPFSSSTAVGFQFLFDVSSAAGLLNELLFGYQVSGPGFTAANLGLSGASATGDGGVTTVQDVCVGGAFDPGTLNNCTGTQDANIVFQIDGDQGLSSAVLFASTLGLGIVNDIAVDGGLGGSASLAGSVTNSFTLTTPVPEPTTGVLIITGMAWLLRSRRRGRQ
jgi:hypothetical protein